MSATHTQVSNRIKHLGEPQPSDISAVADLEWPGVTRDRGETLWLHSINSNDDVVQIYNYIEQLLVRGRFDLRNGRLAEKVFQRDSRRTSSDH